MFQAPLSILKPFLWLQAGPPNPGLILQGTDKVLFYQKAEELNPPFSADQNHIKATSKLKVAKQHKEKIIRWPTLTFLFLST